MYDAFGTLKDSASLVRVVGIDSVLSSVFLIE